MASSDITSKLKRILVVGNCCLDFITLSNSYPPEDSDSYCVAGFFQRGGNASRNCTLLSKLGAPCEFLGVLSSSEAFRILIEDLINSGIIFENCPKTEVDPPFSSVIISYKNASFTPIHSSTDFPVLTYEHFKRCDLNNYGWIHFDCNNLHHFMPMIRDVTAYNAGRACKHIVISVEFRTYFPDYYALAELADYVFLGDDLAISERWFTSRDICFGVLGKMNIRADLNVNKPILFTEWGAKGGAAVLNTSTLNFEMFPSNVVRQYLQYGGVGTSIVAGILYALYIKDKSVQDSVKFGIILAHYGIRHRKYEHVELLAHQI